jgi:hypothetical protein
MVKFNIHGRFMTLVAVTISLAALPAFAREVEFVEDIWLEYPDGIEQIDGYEDIADDSFLFVGMDEPPISEAFPSEITTTNFQPTVGQQPARQRSNASRTSANRAARGAVVGLASIPYMIGDTGSGTCLGFAGILSAELSHPSLTCSRLNISESNTPLPTDRVYYSYRHFHNTTKLKVYQFDEQLHIDRYTLGIERATPGGMFSVEVRIPMEYRLTSEFESITAPDLNVVDLVIAEEERRVELANISTIFKLLLVDREAFVLSGGLGVTLPTAQDVDWDLGVLGLVTFPTLPDIAMFTAATFETQFQNETVYLSPFLSWRYAPRSRWFHQGFLQFEFAGNPSTFDFDGGSVNIFYDNTATEIGRYNYDFNGGFRGDLHAQTLMRLNTGFGYKFCENRRGKHWNRVTGMVELHYTTTLEDARLTEVPLNVTLALDENPLQAITVGNQANRVDILNLASGLVTEFAGWTVTNGAIVPLRTGTDRGFDFEYNLQAQKAF